MAPTRAEPADTPIASTAPASLASGRTYVLVMLTLIYITNMIDRKFVTILQEPIKREFHLADWQLGLMTGLAFAALYAIAGIPIARYADRPRTKRVDIITISLVVWSGATAIGGIATNFTQLLLARFVVGIGEAGSGPPSQSIIADHFHSHERGRAMGMFALASPIGGAVGLAIGGYFAQMFSWRAALLLVGLPGVLLALLFRFTVREPIRGQVDGNRSRNLKHASFLDVLKTLSKKRSFILLVAGGCMGSFASLGLQNWFPSFFMRSFGLSLSKVGLWWGLASGAAGFVGTFGGGYLADKLGVRSPRAILLVPAAGMLIALPCQILAVMATEWHIALYLLLVPTTFSALWIAPSMVLNQGVAPLAMRATVVAISTFLVNMIGLGFGPMVLGAFSDFFTASYGSSEVGLRYALLAISPIYLISAGCFIAGSMFVADDLEPVPTALPEGAAARP